MKQFFVNNLQKSLAILTSKKVTAVYQAGLPDVNGPKEMTFRFFKGHVQVSYMDFWKYKTFSIEKKDIAELDIKVEEVNNTGKMLKAGAIGYVVAGPLAAIAMADHAEKQTKVNVLHLVINYDGQQRSVVLAPKEATKLYQLFKSLQ